MERIDRCDIPREVFLQKLSEVYPPKPQRCVISLIDILGTSNNLDKCKINKDHFLELTSELMKGLYPPLSSLQKMFSGVKKSGNLHLINSFHIYSDHALRVQGIGDEPASIIEEIYGTILFLSDFQMNLISNGYLVRGIITIDQAYSNDVLLICPNISKIHESEKNVFYPLIKVDDEVVALLKKSELEFYQNPNPEKEHDVKSLLDIKGLLKEIDSFGYFVNYLSLWKIFDFDDNSVSALSDHKVTIINNIRNLTDLSIIDKYRILIAYHNQICQEFYPDNTKIVIDENITQYFFKDVRFC